MSETPKEKAKEPPWWVKDPKKEMRQAWIVIVVEGVGLLVLMFVLYLYLG